MTTVAQGVAAAGTALQGGDNSMYLAKYMESDSMYSMKYGEFGVQ
jgi:hypothetical protein